MVIRPLLKIDNTTAPRDVSL